MIDTPQEELAAHGGVSKSPVISMANQINIHDGFQTQLDTKVVAEQWGGSCSIHNYGISQGGLLRSHGGDLIDIANVWSNGMPAAKGGYYFLYTGDNPTAKMRWDNHMNGKWIQQAMKGETAVRLQQQDDCQVIGLKIKSSGYKQAAQLRPGGAKGDHFGIVTLADCILKGYKPGVKAILDIGGIDLVDAHYPGGTQDLYKLTRVVCDGINITKCEQKYHRIKAIMLVDCVIGGKKFSGQWSY